MVETGADAEAIEKVRRARAGRCSRRRVKLAASHSATPSRPRSAHLLDRLGIGPCLNHRGLKDAEHFTNRVVDDAAGSTRARRCRSQQCRDAMPPDIELLVAPDGLLESVGKVISSCGY